MPCTSFNNHITSSSDNGLNGSDRVITNNMSPGCYTSFSLSGQDTYNLAAGVYYLDSANFSTAGGVTVQGTGVTIILTGTSPGTFTTNGNSTIKLDRGQQLAPMTKMLVHPERGRDG